MNKWTECRLAQIGWFWLAAGLRLLRVVCAAGLWPFFLFIQPLWDSGLNPAKYDACPKIAYTNMANVNIAEASQNRFSLTFLIQRNPGPDPLLQTGIWAFPLVDVVDFWWHLQYGQHLLRLGGGQMLLCGQNKTLYTYVQMSYRPILKTIAVALCIGLLIWFFPFLMFSLYACTTLGFVWVVNNHNF